MFRAPDDRAASSPFFLVGAVRSGTTLLRVMLSHHPEICECLEMEYVTPALATGEAPSTEREDFVRFLRNDRGFALSGSTVAEGLEFEALAYDFMRQRRELDGKPIVGATVHNHFGELSKLWPDAKYIYLGRDPRDVARSCVAIGFDGSVWGGASRWVDSHDSWQQLAAGLPADRRLEVRFGDLVSDSQAVLEKICALLGVEFDPRMLEIEGDTTYSRPDPEAAKSWRESAPKSEISQVEARVGKDRLVAAGYEPSGEPRLEPGRGAMLGIRLGDAIGRARFRQRRYGIGLWAAGVVVSRFPSRAMREWVKRRLNAIENQHLK
jgi:hypothetical protein